MCGVTDVTNKRPVDCCKLWACYLTISTNYVPLCDGISGEIGKLEVGDFSDTTQSIFY